MIGDYCVG